MKIKNALVITSFIVLLAVSAALNAGEVCSEPVDTTSGQLRGESGQDADVCVWRGVPYAEPPVNDLRWKAPQSKSTWDGVLNTVEFGDRCMQKSSLVSGKSDTPMSEDCLYLNIWKPKKSGVFPVMVWVHGGGYFSGAGSMSSYWGDRLAEFGDVVVVTINYRLNIFGFMAHPGLREEDPDNSTGGYGTMDQAYSLKWVNENIANFGGDPENVTIFGESAGGWSICSLVASPLARGLFHKAIMQSGGCETSRRPEWGYGLSKRLVDGLPCDYNDLECLRKISSDSVLEVTGIEEMGFDYFPYIDGHVLKDTPRNMIKSGDFAKVPFMAGSNLDEFGKAIKLVPKFYYTMPCKYEKKLVKGFGLSEDTAKELVGLYPLSDFNKRPVEAYGRIFGADAAMQCPAYRAINDAHEKGVPTYFYRFDYKYFKFGKYIGSFHSAEVPFIFNSLDRPPMGNLVKDKHKEKAQAMSKVMMGYWTNFAKTGDPNGPGLPEWKAYDAESQLLQVLDTTVSNGPANIEEKCAIWEDQPKEYIDFVNGLMGMLPL